MIEVSLGRKTELLNEELKKEKPGYFVRAKPYGRLEWELVAPDGLAPYRRDKFETIVLIALGREKSEAFLKQLEEAR